MVQHHQLFIGGILEINKNMSFRLAFLIFLIIFLIGVIYLATAFVPEIYIKEQYKEVYKIEIIDSQEIVHTISDKNQITYFLSLFETYPRTTTLQYIKSLYKYRTNKSLNYDSIDLTSFNKEGEIVLYYISNKPNLVIDYDFSTHVYKLETIRGVYLRSINYRLSRFLTEIS